LYNIKNSSVLLLYNKAVRPVICEGWHIICEGWHAICEGWHVTHMLKMLALPHHLTKRGGIGP